MRECGDQYRGVSLTDNERRNAIPLVVTTGTICADLIETMDSRFDMADSIISATSIADFKSWPQTLEEDKSKLNMVAVPTERNAYRTVGS